MPILQKDYRIRRHESTGPLLYSHMYPHLMTQQNWGEKRGYARYFLSFLIFLSQLSRFCHLSLAILQCGINEISSLILFLLRTSTRTYCIFLLWFGVIFLVPSVPPVP